MQGVSGGAAGVSEAGEGAESFVAVRGWVRAPAGQPVARAPLTLIDHAGHQRGRARSRADGAYELSVPKAGRYVVVVAADGYRPDAAGVRVGDSAVTHDFVLTSAGGTLGYVLDRNGGPVADATVVVTDARGEVVAAAVTGVDGEYVLPGLFSGLFTIAASARGYLPAAVPAEFGGAAEPRCDLVLTASARIVGTVRHDRTDRPIPDARVTLLTDAGSAITATATAEDGSYVLDDVPPGAYLLQVSGYPPVSARITVNGAGNPILDLQLGHPR
ncbi:MSCRAMM family protein [Nocardia pseudobrasiliensis]|nr:carboxypeptidase-like regulatory domain-containing protein [Nocardia pseudobrasiliensis]